MICRSTNDSLKVFIKIDSYFTLSDGETKALLLEEALPIICC
jgi:hypothetical protein